MNYKKTLRNKKRNTYLRRKTKRRYIGGNTNSVNDNKERSGVFGKIGEKIQDIGENTLGYLANKSARLLGYKPMNESEKIQNEIPTNNSEDSNLLGNTVDGVSTTVEGVLNNVNEVLQSPQVSENIAIAAEETKEITEELLDKINKPFEDPNFEKKLEQTSEKLADTASILIDAADEPINKAIDKANESLYKMGSAAATSSVKIASDVLATIPGIGVIFDVARIVNDGSKAVTSVSEASSELIQAGSDLVGETSKNLSELLETQIKEKNQIQNRINKSTTDFNIPLNQNQKGGIKKTRRFLRNRKMKSKRVRFAL